MSGLASFPRIETRIAAVLDRLRRPRRADPVAEGAQDDARARRDFVNEMVGRNPDAFSSELDIQHMMHLFPGRF